VEYDLQQPDEVSCSLFAHSWRSFNARGLPLHCMLHIVVAWSSFDSVNEFCIAREYQPWIRWTQAKVYRVPSSACPFSGIYPGLFWGQSQMVTKHNPALRGRLFQGPTTDIPFPRLCYHFSLINPPTSYFNVLEDIVKQPEGNPHTLPR
jgi:hypothetical protein